MNTKKIITFVLLLAITLVLAGCSGTMSINTGTSPADYDIETHSALTQTPSETPWWVDGGIDSNWPY